MTTVNLVYRRPDGIHAEGTLLTPADGSVSISSVRRYDTSDGEMTRVAFSAVMGSSVLIDPGTWNFELVGVSDGKGDYLKGDDAVSVRTVPASGTFDVDDLTEVPGSSGQGLDPEWKVYIDAQIAQVTVGAGGTPTGTGTGGQFWIQDVLDSGATGRAVVRAATAGVVLTAIGAGADTLAAHLAGTETLTGAKTFTLPVTVATPTAAGHATTKTYVDAQAASGTPDATTIANGKVRLAGDLAGTAAAPTVPGLVTLQTQITGLVAPDWTAIAGKPNVAVLDGANQLPLINNSPFTVIRIGNGGVTVPIRPAYAGPIDFFCSTEPPRTGTTAGGTAAMAPGDIWVSGPTA